MGYVSKGTRADRTGAYRRDRVINGGTRYVGRDSKIISYTSSRAIQPIHTSSR